MLAVAVLVRVFGPSPLTAPEPFLVKFFGVSLWPLLLLFLGIILFRPARAAESTASVLGPIRLPAVVWRERVFWMAVSVLAAGFWQTVSFASIQALFYTGDINRPYVDGPLLLVGSVHSRG